jgi:Cd2+/Zn2+-exporting ATPase
MTDEPSKLVTAIRIARKTHAIVWQNVIFALGVKAVLLVMGALGMATIWEAVFGDVGVAFIAILNAMRAMRVKD